MALPVLFLIIEQHSTHYNASQSASLLLAFYCQSISPLSSFQYLLSHLSHLLLFIAMLHSCCHLHLQHTHSLSPASFNAAWALARLVVAVVVAKWVDKWSKPAAAAAMAMATVVVAAFCAPCQVTLASTSNGCINHTNTSRFQQLKVLFSTSFSSLKQLINY